MEHKDFVMVSLGGSKVRTFAMTHSPNPRPSSFFLHGPKMSTKIAARACFNQRNTLGEPEWQSPEAHETDVKRRVARVASRDNITPVVCMGHG